MEATKPTERRNVRTFGFARGADGKTILSEGVRREIRPVDTRIGDDHLYCECLDPNRRSMRFCVMACGLPVRKLANVR